MNSLLELREKAMTTLPFFDGHWHCRVEDTEFYLEAHKALPDLIDQAENPTLEAAYNALSRALGSRTSSDRAEADSVVYRLVLEVSQGCKGDILEYLKELRV